MSYNPKSLFNKEEHGDPFEFIDTSLNWLLNEAKKQGYDAQASAYFTVEGTTRYARSQVTQHTDLNTINLNLKLAKGKKVASVSSSMITQEGLEALNTKYNYDTLYNRFFTKFEIYNNRFIM